MNLLLWQARVIRVRCLCGGYLAGTGAQIGFWCGAGGRRLRSDGALGLLLEFRMRSAVSSHSNVSEMSREGSQGRNREVTE